MVGPGAGGGQPVAAGQQVQAGLAPRRVGRDGDLGLGADVEDRAPAVGRVELAGLPGDGRGVDVRRALDDARRGAGARAQHPPDPVDPVVEL